MSLHLLLKYVHVLAAIVAVGTNATYGVWMALGARQPESLRAILTGVHFLDNRIANSAYCLLLISGLAMLYAGHLSVRTPWIATALGLYIVAMALGVRGYTPALRSQIQALASGGTQSEAYRREAERGPAVGALVMGGSRSFLFLRVAQPAVLGLLRRAGAVIVSLPR